MTEHGPTGEGQSAELVAEMQRCFAENQEQAAIFPNTPFGAAVVLVGTYKPPDEAEARRIRLINTYFQGVPTYFMAIGEGNSGKVLTRPINPLNQIGPESDEHIRTILQDTDFYTRERTSHLPVFSEVMERLQVFQPARTARLRMAASRLWGLVWRR